MLINISVFYFKFSSYQNKQSYNFLLVKFNVNVSVANGDFEVVESEQLAATGRIQIVGRGDHRPFVYEHVNVYNKMQNGTKNGEEIDLATGDVYKEMLLRGYEYGPR